METTEKEEEHLFTHVPIKEIHLFLSSKKKITISSPRSKKSMKYFDPFSKRLDKPKLDIKLLLSFHYLRIVTSSLLFRRNTFPTFRLTCLSFKTSNRTNHRMKKGKYIYIF